MGSFAVLHPDDDDDFAVDACHLNLWSLSGFLRRILYLDVGLMIRAGGHRVGAIEVLLPVDIQAASALDGAEDISSRITDERVASLIFGEPVTVSGSTLTLTAGSSFRVLGIRAFNKDVTASRELAKAGMSLWRCELSGGLNPGEVGYVRMRFHPSRGGRTWVWGRSKRTALVDLRVNEIRETVGHTGADVVFRDLEARSVAIGKLNTLVIAPSWLELRGSSPRLRYVRLFEGKTWEPYLGRAVDLARSDKMLIYHWRANDVAADGTQPFRGFLAFAVEPRWPTWFAPVSTAVIAAGLVVGGIELGLTLPSLALPALSIGALLYVAGVIQQLRSNASFVMKLPGALKRAVQRAEREVYRLRGAQ